MESTHSALRFGCRVRFQDRWEGRLTAMEVDDDWSVQNIVISRGILRPARVKLPFVTATMWDDDVVSLDCSSDEAFGRRIPPVAVPPRPLSAKTPLSAAAVKLSGAVVDFNPRRVTHLIVSHGLFSRDERLAAVTRVSLEGGVINLSAESGALAPYRRDSAVLQAVRHALTAHPHLIYDDRRGLSVEVIDGDAYVSGNVRTRQAAAAVREIVASVPGVASVRDAVVNDWQMESDAGRALDAAGVVRHARVYVRSALGAVTLAGFVSSEAVIPGIISAVSALPGVRSVDSRLEVDAASPAPAAASPSEPAA